MDWGRVTLVLAAAVVIGFMGTKLTGAHGGHGGHMGGGHMGGGHMGGGHMGSHHGGAFALHADGSGGVYHMHHDHVRHCSHQKDDKNTPMSCTDWQ
jgi:hypothetical protein